METAACDLCASIRPTRVYEMPDRPKTCVALHTTFAMQDPLKAVDQAIRPVLEAAEALRETYAISTFVARKP